MSKIIPEFNTQSWLAAIVESSDDAIISKTLDSTIMSWNKGAERILGYTAEEAIGQPVNMLIPKGQEDEEPMILSRVRQGLRIDHYETRRICKDGRLIDVSITVSPIRDEDGIVVGASKILRDITLQKQTEKKLREAHDELQRLNYLKSEFVSMISHELRTPLAGIQEGINLVLEEVDGRINDEQRATLMISQRQVNRLARLVENVLDISRIQANRLHLNLSQTDIVDLVRHVYELMKMLSNKSGIQLELQVPEKSFFLLCDADRVTQVVINLVHNAIKFTPPGGRITISAEASQNFVTIAVKDTGPGIAEQNLDAIFEMFVQTFDGQPRTAGGAGIGLAVCKGIVERHGGQISVESKLGQGSLFRVALPFSKNG